MRKLLTFLIALGAIVFAVVSPVAAQVGQIPTYITPHISGGAPVTIFSTTLTAQETGWGGYSIRQEITPTSQNSSGQISVAISTGAGTGGLIIDHVSYCIANTAPNCLATPVELTFAGGGHGFTAAASTTTQSDFVSFAATGTDVIVIIDVNTSAPSGGGFGFNSTVTDVGNGFFKAATASYTATTVSGFTQNGTTGADLGVSLIQTQ